MSESVLESQLDEAENKRAAHGLANLIWHGVATAPPESLPHDWRPGYQAARALGPGGLVPRRGGGAGHPGRSGMNGWPGRGRA